MKTITIITPANTEVEYRLAGIGSRLAAFVIDFALQMLLMGIIYTVYYIGLDRDWFRPGGTPLGLVTIMAFVVQLGYAIFCEIGLNGQTIGKRILSLRTICENGQPIGLSQALVRGLFRATIDMLYIGFFVIMFSKRHKRLGDIIAGTVVVSENYKPYFNVGLPEELPTFLSEYTAIMTADERQLIQQWQSRSLPDNGEALAQRLAAYFSAKQSAMMRNMEE